MCEECDGENYDENEYPEPYGPTDGEMLDANRIHIVRLHATKDGSIKANINVAGSGCNPIALIDQIEAQTNEHIKSLKEWYVERVEEHAESDGLEKFVNLTAEIYRSFPRAYIPNLLARAVQKIARDDELNEQIYEGTKKVREGFNELMREMDELRVQRDALRELVTRYQAMICSE